MASNKARARVNAYAVFASIGVAVVACVWLAVWSSGKRDVAEDYPAGVGGESEMRSMSDNVKDISFERLLSMQKSGDIDGAVQAINDSNVNEWFGADQKGVFGMSEQDFMALSQAEKNRVQADTIVIAGQMKRLGMEILAKAKREQAEGDGDKYIQAVSKMGSAMNSPDRLLIFQQIGQSLLNSVGDNR